MSQHFIIDGYNIIKNNPRLNNAKLKDSREALLRFIKDSRPCGSPKNTVTVVFDGRPDVFYYRPPSHIEIIFTKNESADDRIKKIIEKAPQPRNLCVVTDDREIRDFAKGYRAAVKSVDEFISKPESQTKPAPEIKPELTYSQIEEINAELRKIWLK